MKGPGFVKKVFSFTADEIKKFFVKKCIELAYTHIQSFIDSHHMLH